MIVLISSLILCGIFLHRWMLYTWTDWHIYIYIYIKDNKNIRNVKRCRDNSPKTMQTGCDIKNEGKYTKPPPCIFFTLVCAYFYCNVIRHRDKALYIYPSLLYHPYLVCILFCVKYSFVKFGTDTPNILVTRYRQGQSSFMPDSHTR